MDSSNALVKNVILITIDALRWDYLGFINPELQKKNISPFIDQIAGKSVDFTRAVSQGTYTKSAFPAVFYSQYPGKITEKISPKLGWGKIKNNTNSWVNNLSQAGYQTAGFSTNPFPGRLLNYGHGFNEFWDKDQPFNLWLDKVWPKLDKKLKALFIDRIKKKFIADAAMDSPFINKKAFNWLKQQEDNKFFMWLHYMDVHGPYYGNLKPEHLNEEQRKNTKPIKDAYIKSVQYLDNSLKKLFNHLKQKNLLDNTLVIITADHGECLGDHDFLTHPARFFSELVHVPLLMYHPEFTAKKQTSLVGLIDLGPTILDILNVQPLEQTQGYTLRPILENQTTEVRPAIISEAFAAKGPEKAGWPANYTVLDKDFQLNTYQRSQGLKKELYELGPDLTQQAIDPKKHPEVVEKLEQLFKKEYF